MMALFKSFQLSPTVLTICLSISENPKVNYCNGPLLIDEGGALSFQPSTYEMKEFIQSSNPMLIDEGGFSVFKPSAYR